MSIEFILARLALGFRIRYFARMARIDSERYCVYGEVADLSKGTDGLRQLIDSPESDTLHLFFIRARSLLKFVSIDGSGVRYGAWTR